MVMNESAKRGGVRLFEHLPDAVPLNDVTVVGTHDSGTCYVPARFIARCQNRPVAGQLALGVRLLDMRLVKGDDYFFAHGICTCRAAASPFAGKLTFPAVLKDLRDFLAENSRETVLMLLSEERASEGFFDGFYETYLRPNGDLFYTRPEMPTLGEARGKIVLCRRCRRDAVPDDKAGLDFTGFPAMGSKQGPAVLPFTVGDVPAFLEDRYMLMPRAKWRDAVLPALQASDDAGGSLRITETGTAGTLHPYGAARYVNRQFRRYLADGGRCRGWFLTDFPDETLVRAIAARNETLL